MTAGVPKYTSGAASRRLVCHGRVRLWPPQVAVARARWSAWRRTHSGGAGNTHRELLGAAVAGLHQLERDSVTILKTGTDRGARWPHTSPEDQLASGQTVAVSRRDCNTYVLFKRAATHVDRVCHALGGVPGVDAVDAVGQWMPRAVGVVKQLAGVSEADGCSELRFLTAQAIAGLVSISSRVATNSRGHSWWERTLWRLFRDVCPRVLAVPACEQRRARSLVLRLAVAAGRVLHQAGPPTQLVDACTLSLFARCVSAWASPTHTPRGALRKHDATDIVRALAQVLEHVESTTSPPHHASTRELLAPTHKVRWALKCVADRCGEWATGLSLSCIRWTLWGLARVGCAHEGVVSALAQEVLTVAAASSNCHHLGHIAWGLAQLRLDVARPELLSRVLCYACDAMLVQVSCATQATSARQWDGWRMTAWTAAMCGMDDHPGVQEALAGVAASDVTLPRWQQAQWYQVHLCCVIQSGCSALPPALADQFRVSQLDYADRPPRNERVAWHAAASVRPNTTSSAFHASVSRTLDSVGWRHDNEVSTSEGLAVDIRLRAPRVGVLEVDGPSHFLSWFGHTPIVGRVADVCGPFEFAAPQDSRGVAFCGDGRGRVYVPSLTTAVKQRLLRLCGWHVLSVPFMSWPRPEAPHSDRVATLAALLAPLGCAPGMHPVK